MNVSNNNDTSYSLRRIGVFYDGNYFYHVSNYYNYVHERKTRLSIRGLHEFIRYQVAQQESIDVSLCQIVDAHYFRGRMSAKEASMQSERLYNDRLFDDILMAEGVTTHYLPLKTLNGIRYEKGIDVWLALEAFENAFYKRYSVLVLIASDGDYVPLIRKVNNLGTRVMLLSWDFDYTDEEGKMHMTKTSQDLLEIVTYPVSMHEIVENRVRKNDPLVNNLFVPKTKDKYTFIPPTLKEIDPDSEDYDPFNTQPSTSDNEWRRSFVFSLKAGYGFIKYPPNNVYFHYTVLTNFDFNQLEVGTPVDFQMEIKEDGNAVATEVKVVEPY